jgi:hypothetical protein
VKQSPLKRKTELKRSSGPRRSQPKRDWKDARAKVEVEAVCRVGGECEGKLEAAHVIGREHDLFNSEKNVHWVNPHRIVPLCTKHHRMYDAHELDILAALSTREQVQAVEDAGSIETARVRTCPSLYKKP